MKRQWMIKIDVGDDVEFKAPEDSERDSWRVLWFSQRPHPDPRDRAAFEGWMKDRKADGWEAVEVNIKEVG